MKKQSWISFVGYYGPILIIWLVAFLWLYAVGFADQAGQQGWVGSELHSLGVLLYERLSVRLPK